MKVLDKKFVASKKQKVHTQAERRILQKVQSPFIIKLMFSFQSKNRLFMVSEFMQGALECLHQNDIIYRDIKPENILMDAQGNIKLADFGLAKDNMQYGQQTKTLCGTPEYLAPEILINNGHDKAVDWWSLGVLFYEMINGVPPFFSKDKKELFEKILKADYLIKPSFSEQTVSLLQGLLQTDPRKRLGSGMNGTNDVKHHPFFAGVDWVSIYYKKEKTPFVPHIECDIDLRNFDQNFLKTSINQVNVPTEPGDEFTDTYKDFTLPFNQIKD